MDASQVQWQDHHHCEAEIEPLFALLPSPKSLRLFDGGHVPPLAAWIPVAAAWLDTYLGVATRR